MIFDGVKLARELEAELKQKIRPGLTLAVLVYPDDAAGQLYSRLKAEAAKKLGIKFIKSEVNLISEWNRDDKIQGIMVQRPGFSWAEKQGMDRPGFENWWKNLVNQILPTKDVDGLRNDSGFVQATVRAVEVVLNKIKAKGKIVIIGQGMVGNKLSQRLRAENISSKDRDLARKVSEAEIIISASGRQNLITGSMVNNWSVVIDVGWPKGDVNFDQVKDKVKVITPVPGGIGPVSVICLFQNLAKAAEIVYSNSL